MSLLYETKPNAIKAPNNLYCIKCPVPKHCNEISSCTYRHFASLNPLGWKLKIFYVLIFSQIKMIFEKFLYFQNLSNFESKILKTVKETTLNK